MKKFSDNFERDYDFYLKNLDNFKFCGTHTPKYEPIPDPNGKSAKEVFHSIDSSGKNLPTSEPELLKRLLATKASVNFHIKMWAEGRVDGTLPFCEFAGDGETLEWEVSTDTAGKKTAIPVYKKSMAIEYGFPDWVIDAVEKQKFKYFKGQ